MGFLSRTKPTYQQICELADTSNPEVVLAMINEMPVLATTNLSDDAWLRRFVISDLIEMDGVTLQHVKGVHQRMTRWSSLPPTILHVACSVGCENDIILYLIGQNSSAVRRKDHRLGNIPLYYLLKSCDPSHLPALELLLKLSAARVKRDIPLYIQQALANRKCPQEILDKLTDLGGQQQQT